RDAFGYEFGGRLVSLVSHGEHVAIGHAQLAGAVGQQTASARTGVRCFVERNVEQRAQSVDRPRGSAERIAKVLMLIGDVTVEHLQEELTLVAERGIEAA